MLSTAIGHGLVGLAFTVLLTLVLSFVAYVSASNLALFMSFRTLYSLPSSSCLLQYTELHFILLPSIQGLSLPKLQISMLYTMPAEETDTLTR